LASNAVTKRSVKYVSVGRCQAKFLASAKFLTYYFFQLFCF